MTILTKDRLNADLDIAAETRDGIEYPLNHILNAAGAKVDPATDGSLSTLNTTVGGLLTNSQLRAAAVPVSGPLTDTQLRAAALPVSAASLPLPTGAATQTTLANIDSDVGQLADAAATTDTGAFSLIALVKRSLQNWTTLLGRVPAQGQGAMAASLPVAIASNQTALAVNAAPAAALLSSYNVAGVIAINTVLLTLDCSQYRSVSVQCTSMGTTGVVTPEWSNDNVTWVPATLFTVPGVSATTFAVAGLWTIPVAARYLRLRLSTATTTGTTTLSVHQFNDGVQPWLATQPVSLAAGTALAADLGIQYRASATGGASYISVQSPATPAVGTIKATAGRLIGYSLQNSASSLRSVKIFAVAAPTLGTTAAAYTIDIPSGAEVNLQLPGGIGFGVACTYSVTSAKGLTDNTATGLAANDVSGAFFFA